VHQSSPILLDDRVLGALAKKHKRFPALIALCYQLQRGFVVLAQSLKENEIKENIEVEQRAVGMWVLTQCPSHMCFFQTSKNVTGPSQYPQHVFQVRSE
ncbi:Hypothetical predicted protein, partial [Marmota monax]